MMMSCVFVLPTYSAELSGWSGGFFVVGETQSIRPYENRSKTPDPLMIATLKITEVLHGTNDLIGKTFEAFTCNVQVYGNYQAISPALKVGDVCICVIQNTENLAKNNEKVLEMNSDGAYPVGDDLVPCIKGRKTNNIAQVRQDYDAVLKRLRHRRDHPEAYRTKTTEVKAGTAAATQSKPTPPAGCKPEVP